MNNLLTFICIKKVYTRNQKQQRGADRKLNTLENVVP
jgi:hypothetical protein